MASEYDIIIVGAGIVGAALGLSLAQRTDLRIAIVERNAQLPTSSKPNQRVVALGATATKVLDEVGVFEQLDAEFCHPYTRMHIWDENSDGELDFNSADTEHPQLGHMIDSIQSTALLQIQAVNHDGVDCFFNCEPRELEYFSNQIALKTEGQGPKEFVARVIVAADGANSWVRRQAKIFSNRHDYGQLGIVALIQTQEPHENCAWQRFLKTGPLAILPMTDNQSSIVWSADSAFADELMGLREKEFSESLKQALDGRLGDVKLLSKRQAFPLLSQRAERYYANNLVLVGDAAHSIHPLAGQGANLGFKDIVCLANLFSKSDTDAIGDPKLLARYQRQRLADNEQTDTIMSALYFAYRSDSAAWNSIRGLGMNWLNLSRSLRRLLAEQAIGS